MNEKQVLYVIGGILVLGLGFYLYSQATRPRTLPGQIPIGDATARDVTGVAQSLLPGLGTFVRTLRGDSSGSTPGTGALPDSSIGGAGNLGASNSGTPGSHTGLTLDTNAADPTGDTAGNFGALYNLPS